MCLLRELAIDSRGERAIGLLRELSVTVGASMLGRKRIGLCPARTLRSPSLTGGEKVRFELGMLRVSFSSSTRCIEAGADLARARSCSYC